MDKKTVFFGVYNKYRINGTMEDAMKQLCSRGISYSRKNVYYAGFETPHVHVRFVCRGDDHDDLCGLRADAVFGCIFDIMIERMNPGADNWRKLDINLIDYICMVEQEAAERKKIYISTAGGNDEFYKRLVNSVYGMYGDYKFGATFQNAFYKLIEEEEETMPTEAAQYVRQDVSSLAAAFKRVNDAFNKRFPGIKNVIFSGPCTIVMWEDGTKTIVRCEKDVLDPEKGLAMAIAKKAMGTNKSGSNYYDIFKKWLPKEETEEVTE